MKPLLLLTAPVATRSGYGSHSRDIAKSLIDMNKFDVRINSMRWGNTPLNALSADDKDDKKIVERIIRDNRTERQPDIHIQVSVPNEFQPLGKYNIGITAGIENTTPKPEWVEGMNRMNMNIVPSNFTKDIFEKVVFEKVDEKTNQKIGVLKLEKPIEVLFEGLDTSIYHKTDEFSTDLVEQMEMVENDWNFLFVGHWLQGDLGQDRKDLSMLIKTFLETFRNKKKAPGLIIKTSQATFSVIDRRTIVQKINMIKDTVKGRLPNVYLLHGDLEDEEMNQLYNHPKVKAHVSFTHGEGFGRPLLEATMSEKPVVVSNWSGHLDFLNKKQSVLLPGVLTAVHPNSFPKEMLVEGAQWFTVNYQQAARYLRHVFNNYDKWDEHTKELAKENSTKFSLDKMTKDFSDLLEKYLPKFEIPKPISLNLPKLKKVSDVAKPSKVKLPKLKKV